MQQEELQSLVEKVSSEAFAKRFRHIATFNSRLRTTGGRYLLQTHNLEFNPGQLEQFGLNEFIKIVKHELCHYHLHIEGRGYKHKDHDFKVLLKKVGGSRFCQLIPGSRSPSTWHYTYECSTCCQKYKRKRRIDLNKYRCGRCRGQLRLVTRQKSENRRL